MRHGRLFRSSELSVLDEDGWEELRRLGVTDLVDLRSPREIERSGSRFGPGTMAVHQVPFPATAVTGGGARHQSSFQQVMQNAKATDDGAAQARRFMVDEYAGFATLARGRRAVREVISLLGDRRSLVISCFAGKDRTGFVVAVVLQSLGIDDDAIFADFMRSNEGIPELRRHLLSRVQAETHVFPELAASNAWLSEDFLGVRVDYLQAARRSIDAAYGSIDGYLEAAGVGPADLSRLKDALML